MRKMNKKKMALTASALALGALLFAGGSVFAAPSGNYIGSEKAQQIALENAGLSAGDVTFIRTKLDYDDGRAEYEVEFYQGSMEYDYEIDAVSGAILSYDHDAEYYAPGAGSGSAGAAGSVSSNTKAASAAGTEYITAEAAGQAALKHAGIEEGDTRRMEIEFDYDHGYAVYEVEWKVGWTEYSYEINASTGDVMGYEVELDD